MPVSLVHEDVIDSWEHAYRKGMDKRYPTLELVRLEKWYFGGKPGRTLDYGFGTGTNLIHLLECGYPVDGIDASQGAVTLVEQKLQRRADIRSRATLTHLDRQMARLPFADEIFDYIVCLSVLSLLGSRERVQQLLQEFRRVMKPGAKMIVDINGQTSEFATKGQAIGEDVFAFQLNQDDAPVPTYCPGEQETFVKLLEPFVVDDIGFAAHKYMRSEIFEYLACVRKPDGR